MKIFFHGCLTEGHGVFFQGVMEESSAVFRRRLRDWYGLAPNGGGSGPGKVLNGTGIRALFW